MKVEGKKVKVKSGNGMQQRACSGVQIGWPQGRLGGKLLVKSDEFNDFYCQGIPKLVPNTVNLIAFTNS